MRPIWLPAILNMDGPWEETFKKLYEIFNNDFIEGKPKFGNIPVWWNNRKFDGEYEEGFWHIITKVDHSSGDRLIDHERARRLPWCAPTISNYSDLTIKCFEYLEQDGEINTYIWLENWDYVVILKKRKMRVGLVAFLITAFFISGRESREKLRKKYDNRLIN